MLKVTDAQKTFNAARVDEKVALKRLNVHLDRGDFAVVIGSNGAGKSTLLNAISGAVQLDAGKIIVGDEDMTAQPVHGRARRLARVFQDPMKGTAASMTVAENLLLAELRGKPRRLRQGLDAKRLAAYRDRLAILQLGLENRLDTRVELLSGGQRQSLSLLMAVGNSPDVLLLDEHTAALDPRTADNVMAATVRAVEAFGLTTLMVTHNMQHALDYGNRIVMMDAGQVRLELKGDDKRNATVPDLIRHFSVTTDRMLLGAHG